MDAVSQKKELGTQTAEPPASMASRVADAAFNFINEVDDKACWERVDKLRKKKPRASVNDIAKGMIKAKARKTGAVGAITASPSAIPGLGTVTALTFGAGVDITMTYTLQTELVIELAHCYNVTLTPEQRRGVILLITGISAGSSRLFSAAGAQLAKKAGTRFAGRSFLRMLPLIGIGVSAGVNMASTYAVGNRACAYFSMSDEQRGSFAEATRTISGIDERKLVQWTAKTGEQTKSALSRCLGAIKGKGLLFFRGIGSMITKVRLRLFKRKTKP